MCIMLSCHGDYRSSELQSQAYRWLENNSSLMTFDLVTVDAGSGLVLRYGRLVIAAKSFPNHFSFTSIENFTRSRKDVRRIHEELGEDDSGVQRIQLHLYEAALLCVSRCH